MNRTTDTIIAEATGQGGAIAIIRISGSDSIALCDKLFIAASGKPLGHSPGYTIHYGTINDSACQAIDDVIVSVFRAPKSYTGEDMAEISCHGSRYIRQEILRSFLSLGARHAEPGEFTIRAFLAGKMDLSQAEAVADIIAAENSAEHRIASQQLRGGYSAEFSRLRAEAVELVSLLELELDFGEEDVEFADRTRLHSMLDGILARIGELTQSFALGNAIKEGVNIALAGAPNIGKSTLLNAILKEDRVMVSDIAGTTRDSIEETINIDGIKYRFIDTAGIRQTDDALEKMGIDRSFSAVRKAHLVLLMCEMGSDIAETTENIRSAGKLLADVPADNIIIVLNKCDIGGKLPPEENNLHSLAESLESADKRPGAIIPVSAKTGWNLTALLTEIGSRFDLQGLPPTDTIVSNIRHYEALGLAREALERAHEGLRTSTPADLLAQDIREGLHHLGTITGEITTDEVLGSIFVKFCIGK